MMRLHTNSSRWLRAGLLAGIMLTWVLGLSAPPCFAARVWTESPDAQLFDVAISTDTYIGELRSSPGIALRRQLLWEYRRPGVDPFDPFSAVLLDNGNLLIASRSNEVLEVSRSQRIVWSYTRLVDDPTLVNVYSAQRLSNGNTLITDRRADFVIEVAPDKRIVWRYGVARDSSEPGSLVDPFSAVRLSNGNTLITDNRGGNRVIEVRSSDYDPTAPALGYSDDSIVWRYGEAGVPGIGAGLLVSPRHAQRLPNGNTLITDSGDQTAVANRVIEVTPSGEIVWQHGVPGEMGHDELRLDRPSAAQRLVNGNTVIVEEDGERMLEVAPNGRIVDWYGRGEPVAEGSGASRLRSVHRTPKGTSILTDQANERVMEIGYARAGTAVSKTLTLGLPGVRKTIASIVVDVDQPPGTSVALDYSLDGGPWVSGSISTMMPTGTVAEQIRYRLVLTTDSAASTPVVRRVQIVYDVAPDSTDGPEGGGSTSTKDPGDVAGTPSGQSPRPQGSASGTTITRTGAGGSARASKGGSPTGKVRTARAPSGTAGGIDLGEPGADVLRGTVLGASSEFSRSGSASLFPGRGAVLGYLLLGGAYILGACGAPAWGAMRRLIAMGPS